MLFTYECEEGHKTERLRDYESRKFATTCKTCSRDAYHVQEFSTKSQSFGFADRRWDMREKKRLGVNHV